MPARTFRIYIANATSVPLSKVDGDAHLHGAFTPGGWQPPATIPASQTLAFQAESDGFMQGTDGHVVYEISDGKSVPDRVRIDWNNPWIGITNSVGTMQVSTGFFEDRSNGNSADFIVEGGGRRPREEDSGPIITEGWVEILPGLIALPIPNVGVEAQAWSLFVVRDRPSTSGGLSTSTSFGTSATPPSLEFEPVTGASAKAWQGKWEFGAGDSTVTVSITQRQVQSTSVAAVMGYPQFDVVIEERSPTGGTMSISQSAGIEETVGALRYVKANWPPSVPPQKLVPSMVPQNIQMTATMGAILASSKPAVSTAPVASHLRRGLRLQASGVHLPASGAAGVGEAAGSAPSGIGSLMSSGAGGATATAPQLLLDEADGFTVEQGRATLMLYVARNASGGEPMGFGVRYTRRHADGEVAADVMLAPAFRAPH